MICPNCKSEYVRGVTKCADCGVALVNAADSSVAELPQGSEIVSVWQGNDPGECAAVKEALEKAGIPVIDGESAGHFIFPSVPPKMEIYVSAVNVEQAKNVLLDLEAWDDGAELTPEKRDSVALPESNIADSDLADDDEQATADPELPDDGASGAAISEVWNGGKEELADTLMACFREVGIGSRKLSEAGRWHLVVRTEKVSRAKEIVREVVEASPPE